MVEFEINGPWILLDFVSQNFNLNAKVFVDPKRIFKYLLYLYFLAPDTRLLQNELWVRLDAICF